MHAKRTAEIKRAVFEKDSAEIAEEIADCREPIGVLIDLTEQFAGKRLQRKTEQKYSLIMPIWNTLRSEILVKQEDGRLVRTDAARELSEQFREIMIDEYQDSNFIQEALLSAVSGEEEGRWNRFMVGDIKQSIYGSAWRGRSCFWKNIIRMRRTGKASRESISTKLPKPAGGACDGELCIPQADESGTRRHRVR